MNQELVLCQVNGSGQFAKAWQRAGHRVHYVSAPQDGFDIAGHLDAQGVAPDALFQFEILGRQVQLRGLEKLACPTAFWSMDIHQNLFWHGYYGRLFDQVFCSQKAWLPELARFGVEGAAWLPAYGPERAWRPHGERSRRMLFVGRVSPQRPGRKWFTDFLARRFDAAPVQDVSVAEMFDLYQEARIAPNESICGEVNFRLFEAAGCGCAVVEPEGPQELGELFEPGRELALYRDVIELEAALVRLCDEPQRAEAMGRAAWKRVQEQHLARHRGEAMLDTLLAAPRRAAKGREAMRAATLAELGLWEAGRLDLDSSRLAALVERLGNAPEELAVRVRTLAQLSQRADLAALLARLGKDAGAWAKAEGGAEMLAACSLCALHIDHFDLAKTFWYAAARPGRIPAKPESAVELYRLWARELWRLGEKRRLGVVYDEARQVPASALECLFRAMFLDPGDLETYRRLEAALAALPGTGPSRLGILSHLALHERDNWRVQLELGLANLRSYRLEQGLGDLLIAREAAAKAGQTERFTRLLTARDPHGAIVRALSKSSN